MRADRRRSCRTPCPHTVVEFRSRRVRHAAGLCIDAVETLPTDLGTVLVRVAGAWERPSPPPSAAPVLLLGDEPDAPRVESLPETSGAAARVAPEDRPFRAAFSVPDRLALLLQGPLHLELGDARIALPAATDAAGERPERPEATVVDRAVLVERRARRAEVAEVAAGRRAQQAERALAKMETELAGLELRFGTASEERAALKVELERGERELRASRQHAHAEQRLREDAVSAAERRAERAEREVGELRHAMTDLNRRARDLEVALATVRRQSDEAQQRSETAMARAQRSELAARERERCGAQDQAVLRVELAFASSLPQIAPPQVGVSTPDRPDGALLEQERRASSLAADPVAMTRLLQRADRQSSASTEAEGAAAEAHAAAADAQRQLGQERHGRARAEVELGERILGLAREANSLRARGDEEQRAREAAEAELQGLARARSEAEAEVEVLTAAVADLREQGAPTTPQPSPQSAPEPAPQVGPAPASGPERRWLAIGIDRLVAENATAAARLALELLPGQALASGAVSYDLFIGTLGWHEVTLGPEEAKVVGRRRPRDTGEAAFRVTATPATLVTLVAEGGSRRLRRRGVRVAGTLRRGRALRSLPAVPLDANALADAGIWIDPLLLHRVLGLSIEPEWTRGHEFCLEHTVEGPRTGRCFVTVSDGDRVSVRNRPPPGGPTAAVRTSHSAFQRALGGATEPAHRIEGEGDVGALALLIGWACEGERVSAERG